MKLFTLILLFYLNTFTQSQVVPPGDITNTLSTRAGSVQLSSGVYTTNSVDVSSRNLNLQGVGTDTVINCNGGSFLKLKFATLNLSNLVIENCSSDRGSAVNSLASSVTLNNVIIRNCNATALGGGIYAVDTNLIISGSTIEGCHAEYSAGIYSAGTTLTIDNSKFLRNTALTSGGAIGAVVETVVFNNIELIENTVQVYGGALDLVAGKTIVNGLVSRGNVAYYGATGAHHGFESVSYKNAQVIDSDVFFYQSGEGAGYGVGFWATGSGLFSLENCTFSNLTGTLSASSLFMDNLQEFRLIDTKFNNTNGLFWGTIYANVIETVQAYNNIFSNNGSPQTGPFAGSAFETILIRNITSSGNLYTNNFGLSSGSVFSSENGVFTSINDTFSNNVAILGGGGLSCSGTRSCIVDGSLFEGNFSPKGGAMYSVFTEMTVRSGTACNANQATSGGCIYADIGGSYVGLSNLTATSNVAEIAGGVGFYELNSIFNEEEPCNNCEGNQASYGEAFATSPTKLELDVSTLSTKNLDSNSVVIKLRDAFSNEVILDVPLSAAISPQDGLIPNQKVLTFSNGDISQELQVVGTVGEVYSVEYSTNAGSLVLKDSLNIEILDCNFDDEYIEFFPPNSEAYQVCRNIDFQDNDGSGNIAVRIVLIVLSSIMIAFSLICIIVFILKKNSFIIRSASFVFCITALFGALLIFVGVILMALVTNDALCIVRPIFLATGFCLMLGAIVVKSYRVWRIIDNPELKVIVISNTNLFIAIGVLMLIEIILLVLLFAIDTPTKTYLPDGEEDAVRYPYCQSDTSEILVGILLAYNAILVLAGVFFSFKTRSAPIGLNESKYLAIVIFLILYVGGIIIPLGYMQEGDNPSFSLAIQGFGFWLPTTVFVFLFGGSKILYIITKKDGDSSSSSSSSSSSI